ncbi:hypothetical protein JVT61DRAFT_2645 [Boletus reticuloceps]|uniref:Uncharacterized protein n=1 Tax=Boletus reticuloceps TaxID=495285 RepID=A0A8I2YRR8_9AGAM|nr:hypothetical protein JVT61DRAFT_2645 [Boletus reticuloceps]
MKTTSLAATTPGLSLSYNNKFDNANLPVSELACSTPLENKRYTTLGSLPDFPFAGGAYTVMPWNTYM